MPETQHTEYKSKVTANLEREVVAFLNSRNGGDIFVGVNDKGKVVGVEDIDQAQLTLKDRLKNNIQPSCLGLFSISVEKRGKNDVIRIVVASGPSKPYFLRKYGLTEKGVFMRVGSATEQMPAKQIEELFSRRVRNSLSQIASPKRDLKFEQLHIYYQGKGKTLNEQFARNLELLNDDGDYNYVAYLMNDENSTSVKVARYDGLNKVNLIESNEYGYECLIKATNQVLEKLNLENRTRTKITASQREEKRLWNPVALREAVINAFVHNDYSREVAPTFEIYDDRLEITSYGGLPQGLSEQEIFQGYSIPRNQELMRIYKNLDYVEQLGSGVPRILEYYGEESFRFQGTFYG